MFDKAKYQRQWRAKNPNKVREYWQRAYRLHTEKHIASVRKYQESRNIRSRDRYRANPEHYRMLGRKYYKRDRTKILLAVKERRFLLRIEVIDAYGGRCVCCGENDYKFLCVDHINNDGKEDRKQNGTNIAKLAKDLGYPKDKYQILCYNCNMAKAMSGCSHNGVESFGYEFEQFR